MSLSTKIAAAVNDRPVLAPLPCSVAVDDAGTSLALNLTAAGPVGLAFDTLNFTAADHAVRSPEALLGWAERLAARLTYLMEPLTLLEHDRDAGELVLRSQAPTARDGRRAYYEVRIRRDGTLRFGRYAVDDTTRARVPTDCRMTVEALERLADDLLATAG